MRKEYLDGLRGWASLFVMFAHLGPVFLLSTQQLPALPFFMDGALAVYIFFVLSGYVLSIGYFEKNDAGLLVSLAIRRYPRLTIPVLASCTIAFIIIQAGLMFNIPAGNLAKSPWLESFYTFPASLTSLLQFSLSDVYIDSKAPSYNAVLWTMQYELWGSLILLAALWCLRSMPLRIVGYGVATAACWYFASPLFAFVLGGALAEATRRVRSAMNSSPRSMATISWALLATGLLAGMFRTGIFRSPIALSFIAAVILAAILMNVPMQRFLASRFSVFLGRISFPLYLTHLLVICSWSSWLYIQLREADVSTWAVACATVISTTLISLAAAMAFAPIEAMAIRLSRAISDLLLGGTAVAKVRVDYDN